MSVDEPRFRPQPILQALAQHGVRYVLIGGLGAIFHGSPYPTNDVDICPDTDRDNLAKLCSALDDLDARIYTPDEPAGLPLDRSPEMLERARIWNLTTRAGRLDISFEPTGTRGYVDLRREAVAFQSGDVRVPTASLADIIRSKEAANRPKDNVVLDTLRRLLDYIRERPSQTD